MNFFHPQGLGRARINSNYGNAINLARKIPIFFVAKHYVNGLRLRQDLYLSIRKLSKLSPISNLSHGVFFSVDLFFRRRRPMNITGAVAGNSRFHHRKTALS